MAYVEIAKEQVLQRYVADSDLTKAVEIQESPKTKQAAAAILEDLEAIEKSQLNRLDGAVSFIINHTHVQLRDGIWEFILLAGHVVVDHSNPIVLALELVEAVRKARSIVTRLDPLELFVCNAILNVVRPKRERKKELEVKEASVKEIQEELAKAAAPPILNLEAILHHLREEKVLEEVFHEGRGPYYRVKFSSALPAESLYGTTDCFDSQNVCR
jgi:hypothetical protein